LAGNAGNDAVNASAPASAVEGFNTRPDRRVIQLLRFHPGHEGSRGMGFPLDVANGARGEASSDHCCMNADVEHSAAGAQGDDVEGR
jgi:hypothetical protein